MLIKCNDLAHKISIHCLNDFDALLEKSKSLRMLRKKKQITIHWIKHPLISYNSSENPSTIQFSMFYNLVNGKTFSFFSNFPMFQEKMATSFLTLKDHLIKWKTHTKKKVCSLCGGGGKVRENVNENEYSRSDSFGEKEENRKLIQW